MKLAVLSDIHGNITALKCCFEFIEKQNVDGIIFCGDYISDIPQSKKVLDYIREVSNRYKTWIVRGNREDYLISYHYSTTKNWTIESNNAALLVAYNSLTDDDIKFLESMKIHEVVHINNTAPIYVTHRYRDIKYDNNFRYKNVIFGHEHNQLFFSRKGIRFFNPGSAGLPADGFPGASLMILEYIEQQWLPKFYHLNYDVSIPIKTIKNYPINHDNIKWGDMISIALLTGTDFTGNYVKEVKRLAAMNKMSTILEEIPYDIWKQARENIGYNNLKKDLM